MDYVEQINLENKRKLQVLLKELPKFCNEFFFFFYVCHDLIFYCDAFSCYLFTQKFCKGQSCAFGVFRDDFIFRVGEAEHDGVVLF